MPKSKIAVTADEMFYRRQLGLRTAFVLQPAELGANKMCMCNPFAEFSAFIPPAVVQTCIVMKRDDTARDGAASRCLAMIMHTIAGISRKRRFITSSM